ncbi:hypothetical protein [Hydrogenophaga sp. OTU3427]|uniref:hypothetical protein n=1 Tax=Hydrogenophaga sp. OTU3427 TaxID=3043856 RepID=UPI00313D5641
MNGSCTLRLCAAGVGALSHERPIRHRCDSTQTAGGGGPMLATRHSRSGTSSSVPIALTTTRTTP